MVQDQAISGTGQAISHTSLPSSSDYRRGPSPSAPAFRGVGVGYLRQGLLIGGTKIVETRSPHSTPLDSSVKQSVLVVRSGFTVVSNYVFAGTLMTGCGPGASEEPVQATHCSPAPWWASPSYFFKLAPWPMGAQCNCTALLPSPSAPILHLRAAFRKSPRPLPHCLCCTGLPSLSTSPERKTPGLLSLLAAKAQTRRVLATSIWKQVLLCPAGRVVSESECLGLQVALHQRPCWEAPCRIMLSLPLGRGASSKVWKPSNELSAATEWRSKLKESRKGEIAKPYPPTSQFHLLSVQGALYRMNKKH